MLTPVQGIKFTGSDISPPTAAEFFWQPKAIMVNSLLNFLNANLKQSLKVAIKLYNKPLNTVIRQRKVFY